MFIDPKITKENLIDGMMYRLKEIDDQIDKNRLDYKAAKLAAGISCCSACFIDGVIETLIREKIALKEIISGYYGKRL